MYIIMGATGHVGGAVARILLDRGEQVTVVTRDAAKAGALTARGAAAAMVDIHDRDAFRAVLRGGRRLFVLNPPADPATDIDAEERRTIDAILAAIEGSGLERIVAQSTYGAQPGDHIADMGSLHHLEQGLATQPIDHAIIRAAYYMSNWDASLASARDEGVIRTPLPAALSLPMVAPHDLGLAAARLLTADEVTPGPHAVEGPRAYSPQDVADGFAAALHRPVRVESIPRAEWQEMFRALGFSDPAARSFAGMMALTVDGGVERPDAPERGPTGLADYIADLVRRG